MLGEFALKPKYEKHKNKSFYLVKLTDYSQKLFEKSCNQIDTPQLSVQFQEPENNGCFILNNSIEDIKLSFTVQDIAGEGGLECVKFDSVNFASMGRIKQKLIISATDDIYQATKQKMALAEEKNKQIRVKEIKFNRTIKNKTGSNLVHSTSKLSTSNVQINKGSISASSMLSVKSIPNNNNNSKSKLVGALSKHHVSSTNHKNNDGKNFISNHTTKNSLHVRKADEQRTETAIFRKNEALFKPIPVSSNSSTNNEQNMFFDNNPFETMQNTNMESVSTKFASLVKSQEKCKFSNNNNGKNGEIGGEQPSENVDMELDEIESPTHKINQTNHDNGDDKDLISQIRTMIIHLLALRPHRKSELLSRIQADEHLNAALDPNDRTELLNQKLKTLMNSVGVYTGRDGLYSLAPHTYTELNTTLLDSEKINVETILTPVELSVVKSRLPLRAPSPKPLDVPNVSQQYLNAKNSGSGGHDTKIKSMAHVSNSGTLDKTTENVAKANNSTKSISNSTVSHSTGSVHSHTLESKTLHVTSTHDKKNVNANPAPTSSNVPYNKKAIKVASKDINASTIVPTNDSEPSIHSSQNNGGTLKNPESSDNTLLPSALKPVHSSFSDNNIIMRQTSDSSDNESNAYNSESKPQNPKKLVQTSEAKKLRNNVNKKDGGTNALSNKNGNVTISEPHTPFTIIGNNESDTLPADLEAEISEMLTTFTSTNEDYLGLAPILTEEKRTEYADLFEHIYHEYSALHRRLNEIPGRFCAWHQKLTSLKEGDSAHKELAQKIAKEYHDLLNELTPTGQEYRRRRKRFDYLHKKLAHIQSLIDNYDQNRIIAC